MKDWLQKNAWSLSIAAATMISTFTLYGVRLQTLEQRVDRQSTYIVSLQASSVTSQTQYAALNAKLDAMNDLLLYIRTRIDK